jgi:hypothetical protein
MTLLNIDSIQQQYDDIQLAIDNAGTEEEVYEQIRRVEEIVRYYQGIESFAARNALPENDDRAFISDIADIIYEFDSLHKIANAQLEILQEGVWTDEDEARFQGVRPVRGM